MSRGNLAQTLVLSLGVIVSQSAMTSGGMNPQSENKIPVSETSNADAHPILVELFTSEGCSSCPPADALLEKMDALQPVEGAHLIVLSEHVDYWDHDGWKDPHSSHALTERQADYCRTLGKTTYTPQILVDGASEVRANDDPALLDKVFQQAASSPKIPLKIGEVSIEAGNPSVLRTRIEADGNSDKNNADIFVAVALDRTESQVLKGENGGRKLTHVAVVLEITKVGKLPKGKTFDESVQLKLKSGIDPNNLRVVAFAQESGPGRLLGAALWKPSN